MRAVEPGSLKNVRDVARAAGVSVATISRVLNNHPNVSGRTREKVLALIRKSGFRPDANARRLAHGSSGQLCFLLSNRDIVHSFHSRVLKGVEDYCRQFHRQVIFTTFNYEAGEPMPSENLPRVVREHRAVDGLLIAGANYPSLPRYVERIGLPYVVFGNNLVTGSLALPCKACVCFDEQGGGRQATEFLLDLGHHAIAFVGDLSKPWYARRFEGYREALAARGLPPAAVDIDDQDDCVAAGQRALPAVLRLEPKVTAILAQDDETACGLLDGLNRLGISVPGEMSLMGYDDIAEIRYLRPALTTVRVPKERIGWNMAEKILGMEGGEPSRSRAPLPVEVVIRDSCARLGAARAV
jgi:LacI family transcriptional regulator